MEAIRLTDDRQTTAGSSSQKQNLQMHRSHFETFRRTDKRRTRELISLYTRNLRNTADICKEIFCVSPECIPDSFSHPWYSKLL